MKIIFEATLDIADPNERNKEDLNSQIIWAVRQWIRGNSLGDPDQPFESSVDVQ